MRKVLVVLAGMAMAGPALAQGLSLPNLGGSQGGSQGGGLGGALGGALGGGGGTQGGSAGGHAPATLSALQGVFGQQTPEQKRAFCTRVAGAARQCGLTLDMTVLGTCLVRSLPAEDSARVARVANTARGNPAALLSECGVGLR
ncbi:hypothetical protein [Falsiroseomonas ponticola]|uniref:hypothetical protein n=1 Tax=Falsiroseomonas ponticola TaxID=2786951 RepID=UPI001931BB7F|nr:hypothetical protein [Roseomonas ponticola]